MTQRNIPDPVREMRVATAAMWRDLGVSPGLLRSLARSGDLVQVRHGAYATKPAVTWAKDDPVRAHVLRVLAAQKIVGSDAIASHHSAAILHRLSLLRAPADDTVTLTLPPSRRWNTSTSAGLVFHVAELPPGHVTRLYRLPITSVPRTVVDLARRLPFREAVVVADSALRREQGEVSKAQLTQVLDACARWPGIKQARKAIGFADDRAGSPLESVARVVIAEAGLPSPELQATIHGPNFALDVDFLWPDHKVILEADGQLKYNDRKDLIKQFDRDRLLRDAGYQVVHFTWKELFDTPWVVIERIRKAFAAATPF